MDLRIVEKEFGWKTADGDYIRSKPDGSIRKYVMYLRNHKVNLLIKIIYNTGFIKTLKNNIKGY